MTGVAESPGPLSPDDARPSLRIAIVTSIHLDFDARIWKHARSVADAGHQVRLICPWAVAPGERRHGIEFLPFRRVKSRLLRPCLIPLRIARRLLPILGDVDIVHFHDIDILPFMAVLRLIRPVVYDVHENYPEEILVKAWIPMPLRTPLCHAVRLAETAFARMVGNCVLVVPAQDPRFPANRLRVIHVRNYASRELLAEVRNDYSDREPMVVFTGTHYANNGSLLLLDIAARCKARGLGLRFLMTDRFENNVFRQRFLDDIARFDLGDHVIIRPYVAAHDIMSLLNDSTIAISPNLRSPSQKAAIPTKLFEYMAAGLPIVVSDLPYQTEIVAGSHAGLLATPEAPDTFVEALARLVADRPYAYQLGRNGQRAFLAKYSWESQMPSLMRFYDAIMATRVSRPAPVTNCLPQ